MAKDPFAILGENNQWISRDSFTEIIPIDEENLIKSCKTGDDKLALKSLKNGANPNIFISEPLGSTTPLFLCCINGYINIIQILIEYNVNIKQKNTFDGTTCIHKASINNNVEILKLLFKNGGNVLIDSQDKCFRTPLMDACESGAIECIKLLLENNADIHIQDKNHHTALSYCLDFITKKEDTWYDIAKLLIKNGINVNDKGRRNNKRMIHFASKFGDFEYVKLLINEYEIEIDIYDNNGKTPIDYANDGDFKEIVGYLNKKIPKNGNKCFFLCFSC